MLCSEVMAGTPTSANTAPVVLIAEAVDASGHITPAGSTSGVGMAGTGFGQSTPKQNLPQSASASLSSMMMPAFNPVSSSCPANALTAGCVLSGAATWITANVGSLQTRIGQFEGSFGYSFAWFTYSQSVQLPSESAPRTLTWSMFVNAQGVGTWGAPQISSGNGVVLYVRYASLAAPSWVSPSWVTGLNPNAGSVQWQLLDATLTPIQCANLADAGCTLPVGGAFDEPLVGFSGSQTNINAGYNALVGSSSTFTYTPATSAATVQALLAQTGASFALVDYGYTLLPEYDTVSDGYCPNGASSCARAVGQYTYSALRVDLCTCGSANYVNTGSYNLALQYQISRNVVSASASPNGSTAMSTNLLEQFSYTMQSPSIAFNASSATNAGSWVLPISHTQALALLAASTPQVLIPTDGSKLIDAAALLTPGNVAPAPASSVINGVSNASASAPPVSLPAVTSTGSDILYWSANPIPGVNNTYLAVEARCDVNSNTQFIAGYNLGAVEATDSNPNGGFVNPSWAYPQQASPANTFVTGTASCAGAGSEVDVPNSTYATVQYFYDANPSCLVLSGTEGPGNVCPSAYTLTSITDPDGNATGETACLYCASGTPSGVNNDGTTTYACSAGGTPTQFSSLYEVPLNAGGTTCNQGSGPVSPSNPSSASSYGWVAGPWPTSAPSCAWESRSVLCEDQNGSVVADAFCTGPEPTNAQFMTNGCAFAWFAGPWSAPSSACSLTATETRTVTCLRGDGSSVPDSYCVGTEPATSQSLLVSSGCPYQWDPAVWGSCTGGTFSWQYSSWAPPTACGNATQTRTTTSCSVTTDSGSESRSVACVQQSNGASVAVSNCAGLPALGTEPVLTQTCTPTVTGNAECGAIGPLSQGVLLTNGCAGITFTWVQDGYGTCTGGTGTWQYGTWSPANGCGPTTQTRSASCLATANTGSATQTLSCRGSDGKSYPDGVCTVLAGAPPPTSESCTPVSGFTCGAEAAISQVATLTNECTWVAGSWGACSLSSCPVGSHPQSGCGDPYLPWHYNQPNFLGYCANPSQSGNNCWADNLEASDIPASEVNYCQNGAFITAGLPWDNRSVMGVTGDWCYSNSTGGFVAPAQMSGATTQSRSVSCEAPNGTVVGNALCAGAGVAPSTSQPCSSCIIEENHVYSPAEWTYGEDDLWNYTTMCTNGTTSAGATQDAGVNNGWLGTPGDGGWTVTPWVPATHCPAGYTQERTVFCAGAWNDGGDSGSEVYTVYPDSNCMTDPTYVVTSYDVNGNAIMGYGPPLPKPAQCQ